MSKTMSIYEAITMGTTVKNSAKARITTDNVGIDNFTAWKVAENAAFEAFYKYACASRTTAHSGENATVDATITGNAFAALRTLLALIGEVNGHKIVANADMLYTVAKTAMRIDKELTGEAFTQQSIVANLRAQFNDIHNGMNPEYVAQVTRDYEAAKIRFAELKKLPGSCKAIPTRVSKNAFYLAIETELAIIVNAQDAKTWEELEAEEAAREAERKAKRKANKNAKKAAK